MTTPAPFVATSADIFVGGYHLQTDAYQAMAKGEFAMVDTTNFASLAAQVFSPGIKKGSIDVNAFADTQAGQSIVALTLPGAAAEPVTVCPTGAANDFAVMIRGAASTADLGLKVGDAAKLDAHFAAGQNESVLCGSLLLPATTDTVSGHGAVQNPGAVLSTQKVYGFLHVYSIAGTSAPSIAVTVKSAALVGFGSPTTRLTFATQTAIGSDFQSAAGAITDAFWRVDYTITGTTPSFGFAVGVAIQ